MYSFNFAIITCNVLLYIFKTKNKNTHKEEVIHERIYICCAQMQKNSRVNIKHRKPTPLSNSYDVMEFALYKFFIYVFFI